MRRPDRRQRAAILGGVIGLHALLFVVLIMGATPQHRPFDTQPGLSVFDLALPPPPPEISDPPPPEQAAEQPAPRGPAAPVDRALRRPAAPAPVLADAPIPAVPYVLEPIVRMPVPNTAPEHGTSSSGAGENSGGSDGNAGNGGGGDGDSGAGSGGAGATKPEEPVVQRNPYWLRQPTRAEWRSVWPRSGAVSRQPYASGIAALDCAVLSDNRTDDCWVRAERPVGGGIGRAAIQLSQHFRIRRAERNGEFVPSRVQFSVTFDARQR